MSITVDFSVSVMESANRTQNSPRQNHDRPLILYKHCCFENQ